jgi:hypothetical protein
MDKKKWFELTCELILKYIPFTLWIKRKENSGQLTDNIPIVK